MSDRFDLSSLHDCNPRRICLIKPSALGDVVQSLPVLGAMRSRWPQAAITWVIRDDLSPLVDGHPCVDEWLAYERRGGMRPFMRLLRVLRARRFDLAIDLQGLLRSAMMALATGAEMRVGLETAREGAAWAYNVSLPNTRRGIPAHARYWRLAEVIGCGALEQAAHVPSSPVAERRVDELLAASPRPMLAVHPGALWVTKRWAVGRFAAVAARAVRELGTSIVVVGGPQEQGVSRSFVESLRSAAPASEVLDLTGRTSVSELAAVLRRVDLLLTNDSGPMHLAAAVGTRVVGIFTSTDPAVSGPAGGHHRLLATPSSCGGCYRRRCPLSGPRKHACQRDLSVDRVWRALVDAAQPCRIPESVSVTRLASAPGLPGMR